MFGREGALAPEIVLMRPSPGGECAVVLALVVGKGAVHLVEAPLRQFDRLDHRNRDTGAAEHDPLLADMCLRPLARCPARSPLLARQHQLGEFIGQFGAVAEREPFERPPIHIAIFLHRRALASSPPHPLWHNLPRRRDVLIYRATCHFSN